MWLLIAVLYAVIGVPLGLFLLGCRWTGRPDSQLTSAVRVVVKSLAVLLRLSWQSMILRWKMRRVRA